MAGRTHLSPVRAFALPPHTGDDTLGLGRIVCVEDAQISPGPDAQESFVAGHLLMATRMGILQEGEADPGHPDEYIVVEVEELPLDRSLETEPQHGAL